APPDAPEPVELSEFVVAPAAPLVPAAAPAVALELLLDAGRSGPSPARVLQQVSLNTYENLSWPLILDSLANTALLTILTPTITLVLSLAFSWVVLRSRLRARMLFDVAAFLPHAVPNIIFAVGALILILFVFDRFIPLYGTIWVLLI